MTGDKTLSRRNALKALGGIGAAAAVGGASTLLTGSAAAESTFSISDAAPVTTDDGEVAALTVSADHEVTWDGFDIPVEAVAYRDVLTVAPSGEATEFVVYDNTGSPVRLEDFSSKGDGSDGWGGPGEYTSGPGLSGSVNADINWNVLVDPDEASAKSVESPGDISQTSIEEPTDGTTNETTISYRKELHLYFEDSSGNLVSESRDGFQPVVTAEDTFVVTITNQSATGSGSGSGDATIQK